jgi:hypothetical protein
LDKFKDIASVAVADGSTVLLWKDRWNGIIPAQRYPELLSFAKNENVIFKMAVGKDDFLQNFNLPLSTQAHQQLLHLQEVLSDRDIIQGNDQWKYNWGSTSFSTSKAYKLLVRGQPAHLVYQWIWRSKCQMKHKVFFGCF